MLNTDAATKAAFLFINVVLPPLAGIFHRVTETQSFFICSSQF